MTTYSIAIHGGAGTISRASLSPVQEKHYLDALDKALLEGEAVLRNGGTALDAVTVAVRSLENEPLFNAGKGSVFTHAGNHEMDASVMDGATGKAGAVSGISNVKNPVQLARIIMETSEHVFLSGKGAEAFAKEQGLQFEPDEYFFTTQRFEQLQEAIRSNTISLDHNDHKFGTVGAVARDLSGHLAAATSTGGMTNKYYGRIGDSPVIGAGTYANDRTCAVSCTGHGEFFLREVVAYDVSCLIEYKGLTLEQACAYVVLDKLKKKGGEGGLIAVNTAGDVAMIFNSEGMYRGSLDKSGRKVLAIYK